jgi:hypothetical protein
MVWDHKTIYKYIFKTAMSGIPVMKEIFAEGVQVHPPELRSTFMCRAIVLTGTCDLPAKSMH